MKMVIFFQMLQLAVIHVFKVHTIHEPSLHRENHKELSRFP